MTAAEEWQDIATAPRGDGDEGPDILVFGRIDPRRGHRRSYYIENSHWYRTGFTVEFMDGHEAPTHWRPLPSPPQVKP